MIIILIYSVEEILNSFPDMKKIEFNDKEFSHCERNCKHTNIWFYKKEQNKQIDRKRN